MRSLHLFDQPLDLAALRGHLRHHQAVLRLEGVVAEPQLLQVQLEGILFEVALGDLTGLRLDGVALLGDLITEIARRQDEDRNDEEVDRALFHVSKER